LQPATLLFGGGKVTRRATVATHGFEIGNPALAQGGEHAGVCLHLVVDSLGFVFDQNRLDAFDLLPRDQLPVGYIDDSLKGAPFLLDDGQRFAPESIAGLPAQHFRLGRFMQVDSGISAGGIQLSRGFHRLKDRPVLVGRKCIERMPKIGGGAAYTRA
jgi:hypothetical protein